jgi:NAD(P)-dependent dehydrogenase (short-subunit alcohol dehydrogenase family)
MKNVIVVGGSGGLGNALVAALLDQHYQVVVTGRSPAADPRVAEFYAIDTARTDWAALFQAIERGTGAIDAVIFVSGTAVFGKAAAVPQESARQTLELNFWACTASAQAAAEYWSARQRPGKFLAVLSIVARHGVPFEAHYSASKAATARFLECLELEYGCGNIEFISAFPGMLKTQFRSRAEWHGLEPSRCEGGADPASTARELISLLRGSRRRRVIGWRECAIDLADRIWPGLYNRIVLRGRVRKLLESQPQASGGKRLEGKSDTPDSGGSTYSIEARLKR